MRVRHSLSTRLGTHLAQLKVFGGVIIERFGPCFSFNRITLLPTTTHRSLGV
ncbi:MAG: hypothetical protein AVDCRST_MAG86-3331 [uncultured Truepera sp.]|uniref:Uncharacterized protein n=1 Tax=uncultured Truepera sp. TaxID=543023 RepID=A0A6J4VPC8_9DEIN|nr:MAG: hypothetical protein AVDCRST_MAG86-3331 [uncultured Truepera sp.]